MMELFERAGVLSIGSRLRRLADLLTADAAGVYTLYGIDIKPKWFPVLYMLFYGNDNSVTGIARAIGQTHPSVSNIAKEMVAAGIISDTKATSDRRQTVLTLTSKGEALRNTLQQACAAVETVVKRLDRDHSLWCALDKWEEMLAEKSLLLRVKEEKAQRECPNVKIVDYEPEYCTVFKRLNVMWINSHWELEPHDLEVLGNPTREIIDKGGIILIALVDGRPMGVVSLCRMDHPSYDFELAKLAVDPAARGLGVGEKICRAAIDRARALGARRLFLESNTILMPAVSLYRKLGFTELKEYHPAYARGDIQMELEL